MQPQTSQAFTVLLVEDSPRIAARVRELLTQEEGVEVMAIVDNEAGAVELARDPVVDLLVLDLQLREGTGFGVLAALGAKRPPTVVLTNHDLPQYRRRISALGVNHFLNKSLDFERLPQIIADMRGGSASH